MSYATLRMLVLASLGQIQVEIHEQVQRLLDDHRRELEELALKFVFGEVSPTTTFEFETQIAEQVRELGRQLLERVLNLLEAADPQTVPPHPPLHPRTQRHLPPRRLPPTLRRPGAKHEGLAMH